MGAPRVPRAAPPAAGGPGGLPQRPRMRQVLLTDRPAHRHILPSPLARRMACARQPPPSTQPFCRDAAAGVKHSPPARDKPPCTGQAPLHGASVFPRTADRAHLESSRRGQSRSHIPGCSRRPLSLRRRQGRAGARSGAEDSPRDWGRRGDTAQGRPSQSPKEPRAPASPRNPDTAAASWAAGGASARGA